MGLILFAGSTLLLAFDDALVPVGFCLMLPVACSNIVIQSLVPEALREREIISVLDDRRGCGAAEGAVGGSNRHATWVSSDDELGNDHLWGSFLLPIEHRQQVLKDIVARREQS
jgi:hypothetical protein